MSDRIAARLTAGADADIADILERTALRFGLVQLDIYAGLLDAAIRLVGDDPLRAGSRDRADVVPGLRSFHMELAGQRRGAAAHVVFYMAGQAAGDAVLILRILHEAMDPRSRIFGALEQPGP